MPRSAVILEAELEPVAAPSLSDGVYRQLCERLMRGQLKPDQRLKIRDLAQALGVSETPVREAIFQLVRDGAFELKPRHYIRVRRLSLAQYLELREMRLLLEPLAAERALPAFDRAAIAGLARTHRALIAAEKAKDFDAAVQANFDFHFAIYRRADMPRLIQILESLWIQVGPLLNLLYPHGHPTYAGSHQHELMLDALARGDAAALCEAVRQDMIEGGRQFIAHLQAMEAGALAPSPPAPSPPAPLSPTPFPPRPRRGRGSG
jgi:DNA-binding GntR family transcriptional regulator